MPNGPEWLLGSRCGSSRARGIAADSVQARAEAFDAMTDDAVMSEARKLEEDQG
jgi:hypothetical protein